MALHEGHLESLLGKNMLLNDGKETLNFLKI